MFAMHAIVNSQHNFNPELKESVCLDSYAKAPRDGGWVFLYCFDHECDSFFQKWCHFVT